MTEILPLQLRKFLTAASNSGLLQLCLQPDPSGIQACGSGSGSGSGSGVWVGSAALAQVRVLALAQPQVLA